MIFIMTWKSGTHTSDVTSGARYSELFDRKHFQGSVKKEQEIHVRLHLNDGGVSIYKSSSPSIWPLYVTINELHPIKV